MVGGMVWVLSEHLNKKSANQLLISGLEILIVHPKGFEPLSSVPETEILSIELRVLGVSGCKYKWIFEKRTPDFQFWTMDFKRNLSFSSLATCFLSVLPLQLLQKFPIAYFLQI